MNKITSKHCEARSRLYRSRFSYGSNRVPCAVLQLTDGMDVKDGMDGMDGMDGLDGIRP